MQLYNVLSDMERSDYKAGDRMQAAEMLILEPRPEVHELGTVSLVTVKKALYMLSARGYGLPDGLTLGRDVVLLYVTIGAKRHSMTAHLTELLKLLGVYLGEGAYYVAIDTSEEPPTLHAGAYLEDGLFPDVSLACLERKESVGQA